MLYDFLKEYIRALPKEVREDSEFGFKLQEGIDAGKLHRLKQEVNIDIPRELEEFYTFSNGAQLGEYSVFSADKLDFWYRKLSDVYGTEYMMGLVPFAMLKGVGDYVIIDTRNPDVEESPILDGFHEQDPSQWEMIATGLRHWFLQMCESDFQPFWLKR